ncbi:hypothetical protein [Burkholderia sp. LMG 21824]|uniref:hypothetical protein n=1 Tax=Burkholderia sp. LMG 21824 TaxID=3158172 RepID=UPI003C2EF81F
MSHKPEFVTPAVFAVIEHVNFPNIKPKRCALSGEPISRGDFAYLVKFQTYNDAPRYYVSENAARQDVGFQLSLSFYASREYSAKLMFYGRIDDLQSWGRTWMVDPDWSRERYERIQRRDYLARAIHSGSSEMMERMTEKYGIRAEDVTAILAEPLTPTRPQLDDDALWDQLWQRIGELENDS